MSHGIPIMSIIVHLVALWNHFRTVIKTSIFPSLKLASIINGRVLFFFQEYGLQVWLKKLKFHIWKIINWCFFLWNVSIIHFQFWLFWFVKKNWISSSTTTSSTYSLLPSTKNFISIVVTSSTPNIYSTDTYNFCSTNWLTTGIDLISLSCFIKGHMLKVTSSLLNQNNICALSILPNALPLARNYIPKMMGTSK